jgi:AAA domain
MKSIKTNAAPEESGVLDSNESTSSSVRGEGAEDQWTLEEQEATVLAQDRLAKGVDQRRIINLLATETRWDESKAERMVAALEKNLGEAAEREARSRRIDTELREEPAPTLKAETGLGDRARSPESREAPKQMVPGLLVERRIHQIIGHPANGKTTLALWATKQHMDAGGDVLWIDWEETPDDFVDKAAAVGVTPEQLDDQVAYVWKPDLPATDQGTQTLVATIRRLQAARDGDDDYAGVLVVFDSMDMALTIAGFNPDSRGEATKWAHHLSHPAKGAGATVIVIDAPTKNGNENQPYAAGAGAKLLQVDAGWYVKKVKAFDRTSIGKIEVIRPPGGKERTGSLPARLVFEVGDGAGRLPLTRVEVEEDSGDQAAQAASAAQGRIARVLEKESKPDRRLSGNAVLKLATGRKTDNEMALKELAADPSKPFASAANQKGNGVEYWYDAGLRKALDV